MGKVQKAFTEEVKDQTYREQRGRCAWCGCSLDRCWPAKEYHHKKHRSVLKKSDVEAHGPGGGRENCVALCGRCHIAVEQQQPGFEPFHTWGWQEIGQTEADLD